MATFLRLWNARHCAVDELATQLRIAEVNKDVEMRAAITIQGIRRGLVTRRRIKSWLKSCIALQRIWRAYLARQTACHMSMLRDKKTSTSDVDARGNHHPKNIPRFLLS